MKSLVSHWLEDYGAGFKQAGRQGILVGVCTLQHFLRKNTRVGGLAAHMLLAGSHCFNSD